ncbi:MAG: histidine kinase dimerization/phosphoacceptor domain -containing protein [Aureispira sp.]
MPLREQTIQDSERHQHAIVSQPLQLIQNKDNERSFLILQAVRKQDSIVGIIQAVYNVNVFMDTVFKEELKYLDIHIYDTTYNYSGLFQNDATDTLAKFRATNYEGWFPPNHLSFCGRTWKIYTRPKAHLMAYPHQPIAYSALAMGLMMTLIVIIIFFLNDRYARQLKQKVADSTQQLSEANHAQAILLKEIHHRVKNNLQVITGLLSLQATSIEEEATKELFKVSQYRVSAMGMLHEQLYQSENLARLGYGLYLEKLVGQLLHSIKGEDHQIKVELDVPEGLYLNLDTAIPLGLLINEIVTNSLKYGFIQNKGTIYIQLKDTSTVGQYILLIGDNGVGFSNQQPYKTTSLGLQLVRQLVRQLNGKLDRLEKAPGTHYRIYFYESD